MNNSTLTFYKPHIHVKNPLFGEINTRRHLHKVNLVDQAPLQTGEKRLRDA